MSKDEILPKLILVVLALLCVSVLFWAEGGIRWLERDVFSPQRPKDMPANSVWIEAPPLPISWHHGWWFGCGMSSSGRASYCRLVGNGRTVYGGDYLSCRTHQAVSPQSLKLVPPPDSVDMWLFGENTQGVIAFERNGDILVPTEVIPRCEAIAARLKK